MTYQQRNNEIWHDGICIARCLVYGPVNFPGTKNAAEMTAKLNAYPALLAACKDALESIEIARAELGDTTAGDVFVGAFLGVEARLRKAIAQAEGEQ